MCGELNGGLVVSTCEARRRSIHGRGTSVQGSPYTEDKGPEPLPTRPARRLSGFKGKPVFRGTVPTDPALSWLLEPNHPSIRYLVLTHVMGRGPSDPEVRAARQEISKDRGSGRYSLAGTRRAGGYAMADG